MGKENYLTHEELKEVQDILAKTNEDVKLYRSDLVISGDKFVPKTDLSQDSGIQYQIIDKSKNFDYEFTWWGLKVYWSHSFVQKLKNNLGIYGTGVAGFNLAIIATMNYFKAPIPNWLTTFVTVAAGVSVYSFISQDEGKGVYLD
ncbi:hypothetical protein [Gottfriedia acidiceleris]|uniref:hypothetical protein n=1 Tax=Gottfriedia acidiceleris TaxID=371036 RepID=UPI002FFDFBE3